MQYDDVGRSRVRGDKVKSVGWTGCWKGETAVYRGEQRDAIDQATRAAQEYHITRQIYSMLCSSLYRYRHSLSHLCPRINLISSWHDARTRLGQHHRKSIQAGLSVQEHSSIMYINATSIFENTLSHVHVDCV